MSKLFNDINLKGPSISDDPEKEFKPSAVVYDEPADGLPKEVLKEAIETRVEPIKKEVAQTPKNPLMEMEINEGQAVISNMTQKVAMINAAIRGGMLPKRYQDVGTVLAGMQYSKEIGLGGSLVSLRQIAVVDGTPTIYGDLPLSICYKSGLLESIKEYYLDKEMKEISIENRNILSSPEVAVCELKRKDDPEKILTFFSMVDASKAGLVGKGVWTKYPKLMMKYRARSEALKSKFPDFLNGIGIGEYDFHSTSEENHNNQKDKTELNKLVFE